MFNPRRLPHGDCSAEPSRWNAHPASQNRRGSPSKSAGRGVRHGRAAARAQLSGAIDPTAAARPSIQSAGPSLLQVVHSQPATVPHQRPSPHLLRLPAPRPPRSRPLLHSCSTVARIRHATRVQGTERLPSGSMHIECALKRRAQGNSRLQDTRLPRATAKPVMIGPRSRPGKSGT
jgi:hypothetical protein